MLVSPGRDSFYSRMHYLAKFIQQNKDTPFEIYLSKPVNVTELMIVSKNKGLGYIISCYNSPTDKWIVKFGDRTGGREFIEIDDMINYLFIVAVVNQYSIFYTINYNVIYSYHYPNY